MKKLWLITLICILITGCTPAKDTVKQVDINTYVKSVEFNSEIIQSEQAKSNLYILGKVWGFLKYYHPNVATGQWDWDAELFKIIPKILESGSSQDRDLILADWITDLGSFKEEKTPVVDKDVVIAPDLEWITELNLGEPLESKLTQVKNAKKPNKQKYVTLVEYDGNPMLPVFNEAEYDSMNYENEGFRLLALFRYWNIIEYFYPYRNLIEEDWDVVLQDSIPKFISASNELEYKLAVLELIGRVHDSHANIWMEDATLDEFWGVNSAPVRLSFIENKPVVTGYYDDEFGKQSGLINGDVISKINGETVEGIFKEKLKYIPASNYPTKLRDIAPKLLRTNEEKLNIEFIRSGKTEQAKLDVYPLSVFGNPTGYIALDKEGFQMLDSDIAYFYIDDIFNSDFPDIMAKIQGTNGLIIDLRGYPSDDLRFSLSEYLLPEKTKFAKFSAGSLAKPGLFKTAFEMEAGRTNKDYYKGKVIILINEQTQSAAEFLAMAFRKAPGSVVLGSTTAGADGDVTRFVLPGGIQTAISGIGIYNSDGSDTQRVGIIPDITVTPTIDGIKQNKDEVLEKAISLIKGK
ncbi:S41 family peptidase [Neobacillus sp. D3-1R]|uniref:S41 family peptidase n=1 Tax=Neobacillus sp. D3-1R TaxID=3445778 RepID=UPI003F9F1D61